MFGWFFCLRIFGRFRGCFWSFLVFFWLFSSGRFRVFRSFFVVFVVVPDFFRSFFVFFMFRCFRWFARFEKRCDFNRFFHASCCKSPNMQFAKSRISKMLYFPGTRFQEYVVFSKTSNMQFLPEATPFQKQIRKCKI